MSDEIVIKPKASSKQKLIILISAFMALLFVGVMIIGLNLDQTKLPTTLIGKDAKSFKAEWVQGQEFVPSASSTHFRLEDFKGKPLILNFWASWCVSCRQEAHELEAFWRKYKDQGVAVVGIAIQDEVEAAQRFANEYRKSYILGLDEEGSVSLDYGVSGVPETFLIDSNGVIQHKEVGPVTFSMLESNLSKILKK